MFFPESRVRVYLYGQAVDMRKSFDGLYALARAAFPQDPTGGRPVRVRQPPRPQMKVLYFDRSGWCVWAKRLEAGQFIGNWSQARTREIDCTELKLLLEGIEVAPLSQALSTWQFTRSAARTSSRRFRWRAAQRRQFGSFPWCSIDGLGSMTSHVKRSAHAHARCGRTGRHGHAARGAIAALASRADHAAAAAGRVVQATAVRQQERALRTDARCAADAPGAGAGPGTARAARAARGPAQGARAHAPQAQERLRRRRRERAVLRREQGAGAHDRGAQPRGPGRWHPSSTRWWARRSATAWRSARAATWC